MKIIAFITILIIIFTGCVRYDGSKEFAKQQKYKGVIVDVFQEKRNHNMYTFRIKVKNDIIKECAEFWPKSWEYAKIGDSIIKPKDILLIVVKKSDKVSKEFHYKF